MEYIIISGLRRVTVRSLPLSFVFKRITGSTYNCLSVLCLKCMQKDDENHRMNDCLNWNHLNSLGAGGKVDFQDVYSSDPHKLSVVIDRIRCVWELSLGKGIMRRRVVNP